MRRKLPKKKSLRVLKKQAWSVFSLWIRKRDCLQTEWGNCITCNHRFPLKLLQAGHFIQGRRSSVLFDERNCHAQCLPCNVFKHGNLIAYYEFMVKRYGPTIIEELKQKDTQIHRFTRQELEKIIEKYT